MNGMLLVVAIMASLTGAIIVYLVLQSLSGVVKKEAGTPAGNILFFKTKEQIFYFKLLVYGVIAVFVYLAFGPILNKIIMLVFLEGVAYFGIRAFLNNMREKWLDLFEGQLEDATHLLANSLKAGLGFMQGLELVADQIEPPFRDKIRAMLRDVRLGGTLKDSFKKLEEEVPESESLKTFTSAVVIQLQTGGNLSEVLNHVAETITLRRKLKRRIQALTAEGRLSAYVITALPFFIEFMLWLTQRDLFRPMISTPLGLLINGVCFILIVIAFIWIKKIITIEY